MASSKVIDKQIEALQSGDKKARQKAALWFGRQGDKIDLAPLLGALKDTSWNVRRNAAIALGNIGNDAAGGPLILALSDRTLSVKRAAAVALGRLRYSPATARLVNLMKDERLRDDILQALVEIGAPALLHCCQQIKPASADSPWREAARQMILKGGDPLICRSLTAKAWNGQQRWLILETVRTVQSSVSLFEMWRLTRLGRITDIADWCARLLRLPAHAELHPGIRQVQDYIMLGRASQRDRTTEGGELLRAASGTHHQDTGETLLRASDQDETAPVRLSPLDRLRRWWKKEG